MDAVLPTRGEQPLERFGFDYTENDVKSLFKTIFLRNALLYIIFIAAAFAASFICLIKLLLNALTYNGSFTLSLTGSIIFAGLIVLTVFGLTDKLSRYFKSRALYSKLLTGAHADVALYSDFLEATLSRNGVVEKICYLRYTDFKPLDKMLISSSDTFFICETNIPKNSLLNEKIKK